MGLLDRFKNKHEKEMATSDKSKVEVAKTPKAAKTAEKKEENKIEVKPAKIVRGETTRVILAPMVTEKAAHLSESNTYVFRVATKATRVQVATAFKELYGVQPTRVNIVNARAESVRFGRTAGKQKAWKKAYIATPEGKSIQVYEGI